MHRSVLTAASTSRIILPMHTCWVHRVSEISLICHVLEILRFHRDPDDDEMAKRLD
jgi:hypothetical protein